MGELSRKEIEGRVKSIIAEVTGYDESLLSLETHITPDEHSDSAIRIGSLELAELLITLDEELHVNIPDETINTLNTIESVVDYIMQHTQ